MNIAYDRTALNGLRALPKADAKRITTALLEIAASHPQRLSYVTELIGRPGFWRAKKGDYRAIFAIVEDTIVVTAIGHRKEIYQ